MYSLLAKKTVGCKTLGGLMAILWQAVQHGHIITGKL